MPINIYSVSNSLEAEGWKLISTEYKNLNTELEMECPEGHRQFQTFGNWRKHPTCEKCMAGDPYRVKKDKVPPKRIDAYRILALDAATNVTGYSVYDDDTLVSYGTFKTNNEKNVTERINEVKKWLLNMIKTIEPDFIGVGALPINCFSVYQRGHTQVANEEGES